MARQKTLERKRKKKKQAEKKRKNNYKSRESMRSENLISQLEEQSQPTFSRSAFQASSSSNNTTSNTVKSAVLNKKPIKEGFSKGAWGPPSDEHTETG